MAINVQGKNRKKFFKSHKGKITKYAPPESNSCIVL